MKSEGNFSLKAALASAGERLAILLKDDNLNTLHGRKKIGHILAYYKFPLFILCIFLYFIGYNIYGHITHKDVVLCAAQGRFHGVRRDGYVQKRAEALRRPLPDR